MSSRLGFAPERELAELRAYLGDEFNDANIRNWEHLIEDEAARIGDETQLYRTSRAYLYNLTVFAMSATKLPYLRMLVEHVEPGARILDYGCGIGSDGLLLLEAGYQVEFADFANPSTEYLRWRLARRGLVAKVHDLDIDVPDGFDAAYAFDVIEHVADPFSFLAEMESRADLVEVNLLEYDPHEQALHYRLPIGRLLIHATRRDLRAYRVLHGSSHVLLYRSQRVGKGRQVGNLARVANQLGRRRVSRLRSRVTVRNRAHEASDR